MSKKHGALALAFAALVIANPAFAQKRSTGGTTTRPQTLQTWMSPEIGNAWSSNYLGQGTTIMVVDQFKSGSAFSGNLTGTVETLRHGQWTLKQSGMVAVAATMKSQDFGSGTRVPLASTGLNILNLSYGMMASSLDLNATFNWSAQESSIISYAKNGTAVISKSAGNDSGTVVGGVNSSGKFDALGRDLIGAQSAIFVGALSANGTTAAPASMASYSSIAGSNTTVQNQFLVVGVEGSKTGLYGTSFAAPIVSGYAAILGSKFTSATPPQITNQLLSTARKDTIQGYNAAIHGRGEASLTRALAPSGIN